MKTTANVRRLTESAMMIAISTALALICALIPFLNFPFGGGITIASMLPIILISYRHGIRWGTFTAFVYSMIQMLMGHSTIAALFTPSDEGYRGIQVALIICLIDYLLAYTVLGLGGMFANKVKNTGVALCLGSVVALSLRYICHIVSGAIFYGEWAEWFFTQPGIYESVGKGILETISGQTLSIVYSIVYNGCYMLPEIIITAVAALFVVRIPYIRRKKL